MMYQRQNQQQHHQQQQQQHRDNFNDNNYDSSESDSDSEAEMEENNDAEPDNHDNALNEDDALMMGGLPNMVGNENNLVDNDLDDGAGRPHNGILERIDYLSDRRNDGLLHQNDENLMDDPRPPVGFDENSRGNFDLLGEGSGSRSKLNLDINPPINDESSRESMDIDYDGGVELGEINVSSEKILSGSSNVGGENIDSDEAASSGCLNNYFSSADNGFDSFMRATTSGGHHSGSSANLHPNCKCIKCDDSPSSSTKTTKEPTSVSTVITDARIECCCADDGNVTSCCCTKKSTAESSKTLDGHTCKAKQCDEEDAAMDVPQIPDDDEDEDEKTHHVGDTCDSKPTSSELYPDARTTTSTAAMRPDDKCDCDGTADEDMNDTTLSGRVPPPISKDCSCFAASTSNKESGKDSTKDCDGIPPPPTDKENCEECSLRQQQPNPDASTSSANAVDAAAALNAETSAASAKKLAADERRSRDDDTSRPNKKVKLNNGTAASRNKTPRTIFHKALDAVGMSWENQHLKQILASNAYAGESFAVPSTSKAATSLPPVTPSSMKANFNTSGQPLWHEPLAMCAARIDSLRSHGHTDAALRLSVSVVRTMKQIQRDAQVLWHRYQSLVIAQQNMHEETANDAHCCCECRKKKTDIGSDPLGGLRTRSGFPTDSYNKMYRYDYGNSKYSNFAAEGCKRCMETRDRVGYNSHLPGTFNATRFGVDAGGSNIGRCMPPVAAPPMLNNGFGSIGNNMYDQRFSGGSSSRFGSTEGYGNRYEGGNGNYTPASSYHHSNSCHANNCNIVHRNSSSSSSLNMVTDSFLYNPRIHCNGFNRCPAAAAQERKGPTTIAPPSLDNPDQAGPSTSQAIMPKNCTNVQNCDCKRSFQCSGSLPCNVDQIAAAAAQPPPPPPPPPSQCDGPSTSAAAAAKQWPIQQPPSMEPSSSHKDCSDASKSCSKHTKNQCCIKKYCCKVPVAADKYNCCASVNTGPVVSSSLRKDYNGFAAGNVCDGGKRMPNGNIFFGRNNYETCPRRGTDEQYGSCSAHLKMTTVGAHGSSSKANVNNIVNYGASTSKAAAVNADFVRNKKPGCISNCLDCCVGCEIEFPLDAVACIFDCLTEACIIPDSINGPNMGRLSFDSVTGATEDGCIIPPRYQHVLVPVSNDRNETYLTLAFEVR